MERGDHPQCIPMDDYTSFWRRAKEQTASGPSDLHLGTQKSGSYSSVVSKLDVIMTSLPLSTGYSPKRWQKCTDAMLLKKLGLYLLTKLWTIWFFQVDANYPFKYMGREMMKSAETFNQCAIEQYVSRKRHKAIDQAVNKCLTFKILRQKRIAGALCANNALSCYDRICHMVASLNMQQQGVPESAVVCMPTTLQNMEHTIRTAYGDSKSTYGEDTWTVPINEPPYWRDNPRSNLQDCRRWNRILGLAVR